MNKKKPPDCEPLKVNREEAFIERRRKLNPYVMGLQVSCGMDTEVPEKSDVPEDKRASRDIVPGPRVAEGMQSSGGTSSSRSCSHADLDSAQVCRIPGGWFHQGEECDLYRAGLYGAEEKLYGRTFLGKRVLCLHGWWG